MENKMAEMREIRRILLHKTIMCMEAASAISADKARDALFGDYIVSELRSIRNPETKSWLKHRIQKLFSIPAFSTSLLGILLEVRSHQQLFSGPIS